MGEKKNEMKFTILFSPNNPDHIWVANKLNTQSRNNKANYVAQAIMFFEKHSDSNLIEKTVLEILDKHNFTSKINSEKSIDEGFEQKLKDDIASSLQIFRSKS